MSPEGGATLVGQFDLPLQDALPAKYTDLDNTPVYGLRKKKLRSKYRGFLHNRDSLLQLFLFSVECRRKIYLFEHALSSFMLVLRPLRSYFP